MNLEAVQLYECSPASEQIFPGGQTSWPYVSHFKNLHTAGTTKHIPHTSQSSKEERLGECCTDKRWQWLPRVPHYSTLGRGLGVRADKFLRQPSSAGPRGPAPCLLPQPGCPTAPMPAGPCYSLSDTDPAGNVRSNCWGTACVSRAPIWASR